MTLDRLELAGFTRFAAPVVLDLAALGPGLIAITGENGAGKSTLLDAGLAAPFLAFPSRDGLLADYATSRTAYLDAVYTVRGVEYRLRVNVDGQKRQTDAVILQHDEPLNDGKVTTFKAKVAEVFPAQEVLLASAFASQTRTGSFVSLDRRRRKELFGELLGLQHYARLATTASAAGQRWSRARDVLAHARAGLVAQTTPAQRATLEERRQRVLTAVAEAARTRERLRAELAPLVTEAAETRAQVTAHLEAETLMSKLSTLLAAHEERAGALERDLAQATTRHAEAVRQGQARLDRLLKDLDAAAADEQRVTTAAQDDLERRRANNQALIADAEAIRAAVARQAEREAALERVHERTVALDATLAALAREAEGVTRHLAMLDAALAERDRLLEHVAVRERVPCGGHPPYASCSFLVMAQEAADRLATLDTGVLPRERVVAEQDRIAAEVQTAEQARADFLAVRGMLLAEQAHDRPLVERASFLAVAEARIEDYTRQLAALQATTADRVTALAQRRQELARRTQEERVTLDQQVTAERAALRVAREGVLQMVATTRLDLEAATTRALQLRPAKARADALAAEIAVLEARREEAGLTLARAEAESQVVDGQWAAFEAREVECLDMSQRLTVAEHEVRAWALLAQAFGRDGLPTLEIDAAGPTVSRLCNDLLEAAFGSRFTVDLVTEEAKADGSGTKESFELLVYDNADGGAPRAIADLSGGERVIVEEALRAAIALFVNTRNEQPIGTCWRDETTGALDSENATRYVAMLRRLLSLGGFRHVLFVTHNPDAAALADYRVVVADGHVHLRAAA